MNASVRHQIDDLRQEVWCRFIREGGGALRYYKSERGNFGPFLSRVAYQQALDIIRRIRRRTIDVTSPDSFEEDIEDVEMGRLFAHYIQCDFFDELMRKAADGLDEIERALLDEIYLGEDGTCRSVARTRGINQNTIYKHHTRLKEKLARLADQLMESEEASDQPRPQPPTIAAVVALMLGSLGPSSMAFDAPVDPLAPFSSTEDHDA